MDYKETTSQCFTTQIILDVKYRGSAAESNLIEEFIKSTVHNQIALDAKQLFAEDITGLKWISNDEASAVFDESKSDQGGVFTPIFFGPENISDESDVTGSITITTQTKDDTSNVGFASVVIPLATALILFAVWYCLYKQYNRKRKNRQRQYRQRQKSSRQGQDVETGSVRTETSRVTRELLSKDSSASVISDNNDPLENESSNNVMAVAVGSSPGSSPASKRSAKSLPISVDSPERSAAGLPPRPLVVKREVSKQLKKQRKKKKQKKKKKVLALKRINSRDNINELPMISESESECESEYATDDEDEESYQDDDGSSYDASAGCLTPARSSSQLSDTTSSRASSSPQLSPRDELFPSEAMDSSDYEFVIEAPEFSKDFFAEDNAKEESGGADGDKDLPPKVTLQPKMKTTKTTTSNKADKNDEVNLRGTLEIETRTELDTSFSKENGSVMERMLPLPWLTNKSSNRRMK